MSDGLTARFAKRFAGGSVIRVDDWRMSARAGITVLFGASGSGKTTVLRCLAGIDRPEEGVIRWGAAVWFDAALNLFLPPQKRCIGYVPQDFALFPHLSVERNIAYGLHELPAGERHQRLTEIIRWLGLEGLEHRLPSELSGGQQQRVALARAVVYRPRLLLLDEPLSALDAPTRRRLCGELRRWLMQLGIPTVVVTHDRMEAMALGDELVVMDRGNVVQHGPVPDVFSRPANLAVAGIVAVETVQPGRVVQLADGLVTVTVGNARLTALEQDLPSGTRDVYVCIRAEEVILMKGEEGQTSPRNRLAATVKLLTREGPVMRIDLDCGFPLVAFVTRQACEELALQEKDRVMALIKAPQIHLIPRAAPVASL